MSSPRVLYERSAPHHANAERPADPPGGSAAEWVQKQEPAEYYRAAAARARSLEQEATTPRVKQHLRELIDRYDRLAGEVEKAADKDPGGNGMRLP